MAKKSTEYPMVRILWVDSNEPFHGWTSVSHLTPPEVCECVSVGFLVEDSKASKTLVQNLTYPIDKHAKGCGIMVIPAQAVLSVQKLS